MDDQLRAAFSDAERELAADIGQAPDMALEDKVQELFATLPDPLLAAGDIKDLLGVDDDAAAVAAVADELCETQTLEANTDTQRPFDSEDVKLYRSANRDFERLRLFALQEELSDGVSRFQFSCEGRLVRSLARIDRLDVISGGGQQRDEIKKHVESIAKSVTAGEPIPNPVLLVFLEDRTVISETDGEDGDIPASRIIIRPLNDFQEISNPIDPTGPSAQRVRLVEIDFPYRRACFDAEKSALLVDGQQRTAALALVPIDEVPTAGLSATALVTNDDGAGSTFRVANNTVKISTDFSRALLAESEEAPGYLVSERRRAQAVRLLAIDFSDSPFNEIVRLPRVKGAGRVVAYNSLFDVVTLFETGIPGVDDATDLARYVEQAFTIVRDTWPSAWAQPATKSKLMHGAGLRAMASVLVSKIRARLEVGETEGELWAGVKESVERLKPVVAWTEEDAESGTKEAARNWRQQISERQNTNQDIAHLTKFLDGVSFALDRQARNST